MSEQDKSEHHASEYVRLGRLILNHYGSLFPNYAFTDLDSAIDLMAAEITTLRAELKATRKGYAASIEARWGGE
jgi:hypothetical protein